jgi:hypothetical protein
MEIQETPASRQESETAIWRYMDMERFVIMLVSGALRFTKAAQFKDDPWEGFCKVIPPPNIPLPEPNDDGTFTVRPEHLMAALANESRKYVERAREHLFVSSWSLSVDSMAMWQIYGSSGRGIAIKSSNRRLETALDRTLPESHYRFGKIDYGSQIENSLALREDFSNLRSVVLPGDKLWPMVLAKGFVKRSAYDHEKEWRAAIYQDVREDDTGIGIGCSLDVLIDRVLLGPCAADFIVNVVQNAEEIRVREGSLQISPTNSSAATAGALSHRTSSICPAQAPHLSR